MRRSNVRNIKVFTGNANAPLAQAICDYLAIELGRADVKTFSDGETFVELGDNVRGMDVFVIQPTCAPANGNLMELLIMLDTMRRASASRVTAVIPYYGYARQDRKVKPRTPITAKLAADLINLFAMPVLLEELRRIIPRSEEVVVVSPDPGGVERARAFAKRLGDADLAIADKRRPRPNVAEVMSIVGDVRGKTAVIVDDIVDTAGSLTQTASAVMKNGAKSVVAAVTHPVLSGPALKRIEESPLQRLVVTDSIPVRPETLESEKIRVTTVCALLGESIRRTHNEESVSSLFI
jgi:ribose-phosphate pyrophosphokinase